MTDLNELQAAGLEVGSFIKRLRLFHELFDELLCEAYQNGYFRWVNAQWQKHLGWTPEEMTSRPWISFVHPNDIEKTIAAAEQMRNNGVANFENRYIHKNGKTWVRVRWETIPFNGTGIAYAKAKIIGTEPAHE